MATKKDLVEAHAFSRRRLVTAFISGAPGGREVEPSRPGRTIVGGIALSILLIAGAAIASVLSARTPADWQKAGVVVSTGSGTTSMYVILDDQDPVLHPVQNGTSAQLIFGANVEPTTVSRDTLDKETPGNTLGIYGAPPDLPLVSSMIYSGWTACTGNGLGIRVDVESTPDVKPGGGYNVTVKTVADDGTEAYYLVAVGADDGATTRVRAFPITDQPATDTMLNELGAKARPEAITVPADWVRLFEVGGSLDFTSFHFDPTSGPVPAGLAGVNRAAVGSYLADETGGGGEVVTPQGILRLDAFAFTVYKYSLLPTTSAQPTELPAAAADAIASINQTEPTEAEAAFPDSLLEQGPPQQQACAVLTTVEGERPAVRLGIEPGDTASAAKVVDPKVISRQVEPGHGSFYDVGEFADQTGGAPTVLTSQGAVFPIVDVESLQQLGYDSLPAPVVPDPWNRLFSPGVPLSTSAALCPPDPSTDAADQTCPRPGDGASESPGTVAGAGG